MGGWERAEEGTPKGMEKCKTKVSLFPRRHDEGERMCVQHKNSGNSCLPASVFQPGQGVGSWSWHLVNKNTKYKKKLGKVSRCQYKWLSRAADVTVTWPVFFICLVYRHQDHGLLRLLSSQYRSHRSNSRQAKRLWRMHQANYRSRQRGILVFISTSF